METGYIVVENIKSLHKLYILKLMIDFYRSREVNLGLKWWKDFLDRVEIFGEEEIPYQVSFEEFTVLKQALLSFATIKFNSTKDSTLKVIVSDINFELSTRTISGVDLTDKDLGKEVFMFKEHGKEVLFGKVGNRGKLLHFLTFKGKDYVTVTTNGVTTSFEPLTDNFILLEENVC